MTKNRSVSRGCLCRGCLRKTVTVIADSDHFTVTDGNETIAVVPRATAREISRYKACATQRSRGGEQYFGPRR